MSSETQSEYTNKPDHYFDGARNDFVARLAQNDLGQILEIGCSAGATGALALAQGKCEYYVGVELMPDIAEQARQKLSEVHCVDIEQNPPEFENERFDAIIASEIFEHLRDPWQVLAKLVPSLKPGGVVLASSPNISHKAVISALLRGKFEYDDMGVMDRTHLRWFTPYSYSALMESAGLKVTECWPITPTKSKHKFLAKILPISEHVFWRQICVEARKP